MNGSRIALAVWLSLAGSALADVIDRLPTQDKVVALTFDACEAGRPVHLDHRIADWLVANRIPFTVFAGGRFAQDNAADLRWLADQPFVEVENHSYRHNNHMPSLPDARVRAEVTQAEDAIRAATGVTTHLFRFPAGNSDPRSRALVEALGYRIVGWTWAAGDPDPHVSAAVILRDVRARTRPGDILIFHINGRGWHTAEALPAVVAGLRAQGYRLVLLRDYLAPSAGPSPTT